MDNIGLAVSQTGPMDHPYPSEGTFNISDVIEVIQSADPEYADTTMPAYTPAGSMYSGVSIAQAMDTSMPVQDPEMDSKKRSYVKIMEQPASKALRFRYECEGRSAGSIPGASSTPEKKTYPKIQVYGYKGRAVVVVSCVTKDPPYRPHPHNLVGKEGCKRGVCTMEITSDDMGCEFSNLGIQCVKKKDIEEALKIREEIRVDPFQTGFVHRNQPTSIDLNSLRLCFQVFLEGSEKRKFTFPLKPVVSEPIYDKKAMCDLVICKLSDCSSSVTGDKEIILLCDKVAKDDIQVRFYEEKDGKIVWEGFGDFQPSDVHKQVAISFRSPRYKDLEVESPVKVYIQLRRPTDGATSESRPFEYLPLSSDPEMLKRKRQKLADSNSGRLARYFHDNSVGKRPILSPFHQQKNFGRVTSPEAMQPSPLTQVKLEPPDQSPTYAYSPQLTMPGYSSTVTVGPSSPHTDFLARQTSPSVPMSMSPLPHSQPQYLQQQNSNIFTQQHYPAPSMAPTQMLQGACGGGHVSSVLDLDQQTASVELSMANLDSGDFAAINLPLSDANLSLLDSHLSENLSSNLNLLDMEGMGKQQNQQENMSDSFTRLTTSTIQELHTLNMLSQPSNPNG